MGNEIANRVRAAALLLSRQSNGNVVGESAEPEEKPVDKNLLPIVPSEPTCMMDDAAVENTEFVYSDRGPDDWVSSGPLGDFGVWRKNTERHFDNWDEATAWAKGFYGVRFKGRKPDEPGCAGRWAFVIKGPRGTIVGN